MNESITIKIYHLTTILVRFSMNLVFRLLLNQFVSNILKLSNRDHFLYTESELKILCNNLIHRIVVTKMKDLGQGLLINCLICMRGLDGCTHALTKIGQNEAKYLDLLFMT
jgi:hypothetical protein